MDATQAANFMFRFFANPADFASIQTEGFASDSVFDFSMLSKDKKGEGHVLVVKTREKYAFAREIEPLIPDSMLGEIEKSIAMSPEESDGRKVFDVIVLRSESRDDLRSLQRQLLNLRAVSRSGEEQAR